MNVKNWTWKTWVTVIAVASIFLAAAILVPIGVLTHTETGLMGVCFNDHGAVTAYEEEGPENCPELHWTQPFPLAVAAQTSNPHPVDDPDEAGRSAVDLVNSQLGFNAFAFEGGGCMEAHSVCMRIGEPFESGHGGIDSFGDTEHRRFMWEGSGLMDCQIRTSNTGNTRILHRALVHELGHCLGLGHDDFDDSIMYESMVNDSQGQMRFVRFTDSDRNLLRDLYMP